MLISRAPRALARLFVADQSSSIYMQYIRSQRRFLAAKDFSAPKELYTESYIYPRGFIYFYPMSIIYVYGAKKK